MSGKTLKKNTDYTVSYKNNTYVGTATITITGKGNYTGTKKATFTIKDTKLNNTSLSLDMGKTYQLNVTGATQSTTWNSSNKAIASVTSAGLVKGIKKGTCTITAKCGSMKLACKVTVNIPKVIITTAKSPIKSEIQLRFKAISGISMYQIQMATDRKFLNCQIKMVKKVEILMGGLPSKKTMYIRIRAVTDDQQSFGPWSDVATAKVK